MNASDFGYMIRFDPAKAKKTILDTYKANGCHKGKTAIALGCRPETFSRWLTKLELHADMERVYAAGIKGGWNEVDALRRRGGRPKGSKPKKATKPARSSKKSAKSSKPARTLKRAA